MKSPLTPEERAARGKTLHDALAEHAAVWSKHRLATSRAYGGAIHQNEIDHGSAERMEPISSHHDIERSSAGIGSPAVPPAPSNLSSCAPPCRDDDCAALKLVRRFLLLADEMRKAMADAGLLQ